MQMNRIEDIEKQHLKKLSTGKKMTEFFPGDTIKVNVRIVEGKRIRVQAFEGVCIAKKNGGINSSFTVRKVSFGEGVERVFQLYSPNLDSVELIRSGKVRRAKLYYLRDRSGKSARINEKIKKKLGIDVAKEEAVKENLEEQKVEATAEAATQVKDESSKSEDSKKEVKEEAKSEEKK
jgi:large subunit ribosomal protein L19